MFNSKKIGNKIGFGNWSSYCGSSINAQTQNTNCYNLSRKIIDSAPSFINSKGITRINRDNIRRPRIIRNNDLKRIKK